MDRQAHWQTVYNERADEQLSWHQPDPQPSLDLILEVCGASGAPGRRIIDVGGGSSHLVDRLLDFGFQVAVLDVSAAAIERSKAQLGPRAAQVRWIVADVTEARDLGQFDVWHDRALLHFLTDEEDRAKYVRLAEKTVAAGGHLIVGTFAADGPAKCSGLDVRRYDGPALSEALGAGFELVRQARATHHTPWGKEQPFLYGVYRRSLER